MDAKIKKEWVEKLRSGEYKQGRLRLKNDIRGHCCIGVLCEVLIEQKRIKEWAHKDELGDYYLDLEGTIPTFIGLKNTKILKEINLTKEDHGHLIDMNDLDGKSFEEIADWIENNISDD